MTVVLAATSSGGGISIANLSGAVTFLVGLLAVVAVIAAVVANARSTYGKTVMETLKASNAALKERVETLEDSQNACMDRVDEVERRNDSLEAENGKLRTYVSGTEAIARLATQIADQHTDTMARWAEISEALNGHILVDHHQQRQARRAPGGTQ